MLVGLHVDVEDPPVLNPPHLRRSQSHLRGSTVESVQSCTLYSWIFALVATTPGTSTRLFREFLVLRSSCVATLLYHSGRAAHPSIVNAEKSLDEGTE